MLLLIIVLVLLFGVGGGYYGHSRWGMGGGISFFRRGLNYCRVLYFVCGGLRL